MSTQGRTSDQPAQTPQSDVKTAPPAPGEGANLLHRWVRLVQQSTLWGNDAGQLRLDELAQGPTTPRIQTLEEIRAARTAAVADEEAAEGAESPSWWEDAVCTDDEAVDEVCALEPDRAQMLPYLTPPTALPTVLPAAAEEGLLARILSFGARWLGPVVVGMWPKPTAPPELTDYPDVGPVSGAGPDGGLEPVGDELPKDDNKCEAEEVKHLGGHALHDMCADTLPGNSIPGSDLQVRTPLGEEVNYDALTRADNTVWEVKTDRYSSWSEWLRPWHLTQQIEAFRHQNRIARECGYGFRVSVSDEAQYLDLVELLADEGIAVEYREDCPNDEP